MLQPVAIIPIHFLQPLRPGRCRERGTIPRGAKKLNHGFRAWELLSQLAGYGGYRGLTKLQKGLRVPLLSRDHDGTIFLYIQGSTRVYQNEQWTSPCPRLESLQ